MPLSPPTTRTPTTLPPPQPPITEFRRLCKGICKEFKLDKIYQTPRYQSGQVFCMSCNVWIDIKGCCLVSGKKITLNSDGWVCKCCNRRIRRNPRNTREKARLRARGLKKKKLNLGTRTDLSSFSKRRALMIKKLTGQILNIENGKGLPPVGGRPNYVFASNVSNTEIELEFNVPISKLLAMAHKLRPPNKISLIVEFERVRLELDRVPTKQEFIKRSKLRITDYNKEFTSWEHMLERLFYDPFYRDRK